MRPFEGTVLTVTSDAQHGFSKHAKESINLVEGHGVEDDAHAGQYVRHQAKRGLRFQSCSAAGLAPLSGLLLSGRDDKEVVITPAFRQRSDPGAIDADDP
jgi:hypothetical protein